jgi:hypothetical protein
MGNAANALIGVNGAVYRGAADSTLPTDNTTALDATFKDLGYISDSGVTQKISTNSTTISAWQNGDTVRTVQTSQDLTYEFAMLETTDETLSTFYGDDNFTAATASQGYIVKVTGEQGVRGTWVLEVEDGENPTVRVVLPDAQVTARGDIVWKSDTVISYDVTLTAYPDADGNKAYIYGGAATS